MKIFYKLLLLAMLGLIAGGCDQQSPDFHPQPDESFVLKTGSADGKLAFIGVGGEIDGQINPDLIAQAGETVRVVVVNGDGVPHDFAIPELSAQTPLLAGKDVSMDVTFEATETMNYSYFCTVAGHRQAGMEGMLIVETAKSQASAE